MAGLKGKLKRSLAGFLALCMTVTSFSGISWADEEESYPVLVKMEGISLWEAAQESVQNGVKIPLNEALEEDDTQTAEFYGLFHGTGSKGSLYEMQLDSGDYEYETAEDEEVPDGAEFEVYVRTKVNLTEEEAAAYQVTGDEQIIFLFKNSSEAVLRYQLHIDDLYTSKIRVNPYEEKAAELGAGAVGSGTVPPTEAVESTPVSEETLPQESVSETTAPEETLPEETVTDTTASDEALPEETVTETPASDETLPDESVTDTTVEAEPEVTTQPAVDVEGEGNEPDQDVAAVELEDHNADTAETADEAPAISEDNHRADESVVRVLSMSGHKMPVLMTENPDGNEESVVKIADDTTESDTAESDTPDSDTPESEEAEAEIAESEETETEAEIAESEKAEHEITDAFLDNGTVEETTSTDVVLTDQNKLDGKIVSMNKLSDDGYQVTVFSIRLKDIPKAAAEGDYTLTIEHDLLYGNTVYYDVQTVEVTEEAFNEDQIYQYAQDVYESGTYHKGGLHLMTSEEELAMAKDAFVWNEETKQLEAKAVIRYELESGWTVVQDEAEETEHESGRGRAAVGFKEGIQTQTDDKYPIYRTGQTFSGSVHETYQTVGEREYHYSETLKRDVCCASDCGDIYADRGTHYVRILYSNDENIITYIRCDEYNKEVPEEIYYKVTFWEENNPVYLLQTAVHKDSIVSTGLNDTRTLPTHTSSGETIIAWVIKDGDKTVQFSNDPSDKTYAGNYKVTKPVDFTAIVQPEATYTVKYMDNTSKKEFSEAYNAADIVDHGQYAEGSQAALLGDYNEYGHDQSGKKLLIGWSLENKLGNAQNIIKTKEEYEKYKDKIYHFGQSLTVSDLASEDCILKLYPVWGDSHNAKIVIKYQVSPAGAAGLTVKEETLYWGQDMKGSSVQSIQPGYEFLGWEEKNPEKSAFIPTEWKSATYTASFKPLSIDIHYKAAGGTVKLLGGSSQSAVSVSESLNPVLDHAAGAVAVPAPGYQFEKWTYHLEGSDNQQDVPPAWVTTSSGESTIVPQKVKANGINQYQAATYTAHFSLRQDLGYKIAYYADDVSHAPLGYSESITGLSYGTQLTENSVNSAFPSMDWKNAKRPDQGYKRGVAVEYPVIGVEDNLVKVVYLKESYSVTYQYEGTVPDGASELPKGATYQYESQVQVAADAAASGYDFSGWRADGVSIRDGMFSMPGKAVVLKGKFTVKSGTRYQVKHYLQNLNGNGYTQEGRVDDLSGMTAAEIKPGDYSDTIKSYIGFQYDQVKSEALNAGKTIAGDGSTVIELYYSRASYPVTYEYEGFVPSGASELPKQASYQYESNVSLASDASASGYSFEGWTVKDVTVTGGQFSMPGNAVVITGTFTANSGIKYHVEHYLQKLNEEDYVKEKRIDELNGTTAVEIKPSDYSQTIKSYIGFRYDRNKSEAENAGKTIAGDGSTVIKLYYTRESYPVTYQYEGTVPSGASALPQEISHQFESEVQLASEAAAPGYSFGGWTADEVSVDSGKFSMPGKAVVLKGRFTANRYEVTYYVDGQQYGAAEIYDYNTPVTVKANPEKSGYSFSGWSKTGTFQMPAENMRIEGTFSRNSAGGGSGDSGSSGGGGSRPDGNRPFVPGGPGDSGEMVTVNPENVPLANLPSGFGSPIDNLVLIQDGNVPLAGLPKTGDKMPVQGFAAVLSGLLMAAYMMFSGRKKED